MIWLISECHPLIGIYELDCREGGNSAVPVSYPRDTAPPSVHQSFLIFHVTGTATFFFFKTPQLRRLPPALSATAVSSYTLYISNIFSFIYAISSVNVDRS